MNARLAIHLQPHQLPELQRAARALLHQPLVTASRGDDFRLVLKWETVLRNEFGQKLGYRLDVSRSAARLLRRPAALTASRGASLATGRLLSRWGYVYLCLALAALEHPGHQVLASELLQRIAQLARGDARLQLNSTEYVQRRAFRDAVRYLEEVGVLTVCDGDVESLLNDGQVLWDIDRDAAAMCMVASPSVLRSVSTVADFITEPTPTDGDGRSRRARHLLNRRMVDQPVVMLSDLTDDEAELAWRNRRREADNISRLTGCEVELRREGVALIDHPNQPLAATPFPGSSATAHAALLWLTALLELKPATAPTDEFDDDASDLRTEFVVDSDIADATWATMLGDYAARLSQDAREQPERFRAEVAGLLKRFRLVVPRPDGIAVTAFANRYRARPAFVGDEPAEATQQLMF
ncbi:MAG TPA: TIGR02678 family protein [Ilumatobacter sp.]|nr:TIGR02678 family protein [Ilumatobacter sp.]